MQCIDVAALVAASILRKNPSAEILPFEQAVVRLDLNPRDSIMSNAQRLASIGGGGTNCSAPVKRLNRRGAKGDLIIFVSDNESWVDSGSGRGTELMNAWQRFRQRKQIRTRRFRRQRAVVEIRRGKIDAGRRDQGTKPAEDLTQLRIDCEIVMGGTAHRNNAHRLSLQGPHRHDVE